jgi:redox-regulated HSP33 family molecular chaperone
VSQVLEHYMHHSEQLDTRLWLAADRDRAVGMLLQKLPGDGGIVPRNAETDADTWERVCTLGGTMSAKELLEVEPEVVFGASSGRRTCSTSSRPARASSARARAKRSVRCCACWAATKSTA